MDQIETMDALKGHLAAKGAAFFDNVEFARLFDGSGLVIVDREDEDIDAEDSPAGADIVAVDAKMGQVLLVVTEVSREAYDVLYAIAIPTTEAQLTRSRLSYELQASLDLKVMIKGADGRVAVKTIYMDAVTSPTLLFHSQTGMPFVRGFVHGVRVRRFPE